jgi:hypothetical protein
MSQKLSAALALALLAASSIGANSAPANSLRELSSGLSACVKAPGASAGSELTIVFALKRDGSLLGKPRIAHARLTGDPAAQRAFVADAIAAFAKCLPVNITDDLGGAIAGRLLVIRIGRRPKETDA